MNTKKTINECIRLSRKIETLKSQKNFCENLAAKNGEKTIIKNLDATTKIPRFYHNLLFVHKNETLGELTNIFSNNIEEFMEAFNLIVSYLKIKENLMIKTILQTFEGAFFLEENLNFEKVEWKYTFDQIFEKLKRKSGGEKRLFALALYFYDPEEAKKAFKNQFDNDNLIDWVYVYSGWDANLSKYIEKMKINIR